MQEVRSVQVVYDANTIPGVVNFPDLEYKISSEGCRTMSWLVVVLDER
jgi:hypothetical protein